MRKIVEELRAPEGFGVIVRTAGESCTKAMLVKDLGYLMKLWKIINNKRNNFV